MALCNQGFTVYVGHLRDKEIDFVAQKNHFTLYVQVAYSIENEETRIREENSLLATKDNFQKWIITLDELPFSQQNGIEYIPAWELGEKLKRLQLE